MKLPKLKYNSKIKNRKELQKLSQSIKYFLSLKIVQVFFICLFLVIVTPLIIFYFLRPKVNHDVKYGVTFSDRYAREIGLDWKQTYLEVLDDLAVEKIRLVAYWGDIEVERDVSDFSTIRWQVEEAQKRDVDVILALGRKVPRWPECIEPGWWNELEEESIRDQELMEHVKNTVNTLKEYDNIKMWQVENEPFWPFGICKYDIKRETVKKEVALVRSLDSRPIIIQDSGEGGAWLPTYRMGDYLGISMYRKIWYDFWGVFLGESIYFKYPLAYWSYKIKAHIVGVPFDKVIVTELQGEPWGPEENTKLPRSEINKSMSRNDFLATISYAQKSGVNEMYLWGVEWWYWEKTKANNSFYWNTAKEVFRSH